MSRLEAYRAEVRALRATMATRPLTAAEFRRLVQLAGLTDDRLL